MEEGGPSRGLTAGAKSARLARGEMEVQPGGWSDGHLDARQGGRLTAIMMAAMAPSAPLIAIAVLGE